MVRVHVLVEGQTEEMFVKEVLLPHFNGLELYLTPWLAGKHGGIGRYERDRGDLLKRLKQDRSAFCTMMVDYYGMPTSWPERETAAGDPEVIEQAILADISNAMGRGFDPARFIPYVQMHEFEALLFSDPKALADGLASVDEATVRAIRDQVATPEEIDDDPQTAPSKRIERLDSSYQKVNDGILIAQRIGLNVMREECPHFHEWIQRLETLAND